MNILDTCLGDNEVVPNTDNINERHVPTTDEQVKYMLSLRGDRLMAQSMWGHYCCERHLGLTIIQAWMNILLVSLGQPRKYFNEHTQ